MIMRLIKFAPVAALALLGIASNAVPAAADGYGCNGCGYEPPPVVVYQSGCGCGGGSYYSSYAPANTYPSAAYYGYAAYGDGYGYPGYGYGYAGAAYRAAISPYRYVNRFYRPRVYGGPRARFR